MKKFLKDIEPGDTFRFSMVDTHYTATQVHSDQALTAVTYVVQGAEHLGKVRVVKASLTHVIVVES